MTDTNEGTTATAEEAPEAQTEPQGTQTQPDEVTTLRSRNAGLDAKVTQLSKTAQEAEKRATEALQKLSDYEAGKVNADEALRAQLLAKEAELAQTRKEAELVRIQAQYPETFSVLGDAAALMSPDKLAEAEARFKGVDAPEISHRPPTPVGNSVARPPSGEAKRIEDMSLEELKLYAEKQFSNMKWSDISRID